MLPAVFQPQAGDRVAWGRPLNFTATAGSIRLFDHKGEAQADIAYTCQLDGADCAGRPVTFVFNGGPGAATAWLQFGNNGPWLSNSIAAGLWPITAQGRGG